MRLVVDSNPTRGNENLNLFVLVSRQKAALSSVIQHIMPPEFDGKWETECLNTRFPLSTLLCAESSLQLISLIK